ncbi:serine hydrolase domain-containing protein [Actinoalloteichus sp. GBA129-24]|uniref:serine hydrolase domain-containing protein n=1 Tax=Actinoalloteichus sp. GBA129-24 TaxID=1612551 RepID=UPI000950643C|nr:serine hydrolase domain-containing protein [Actinoalloteichus sp. GBA129-24]APU22073.1 penicillin-binding protein, beta-lactamase class C [Actinoalloteichus sp. GBA129-24]
MSNTRLHPDRRRRRLAALTAGLILCAPHATASATTEAGAPADRATIEAELARMVEAGAPGVAVTIADGARRWQAAGGLADLTSGTPMPAESTFRAASLTKSMVAAAVLRLVDQARLSLDDTLDELVPGLVPGEDVITVEHLVRHTSGLADYTVTLEQETPAEYGSRTFAPADLVEMGVALGAVSRPGEAFHYSNTGYVLLGMIVEATTGQPLPEVLRDEVFTPAGMADTFLPGTEPRLPQPHPTGYVVLDGQRHEVTEINPSFAWAAYGAVSTAEDLQRLFASLLTGGLLSPELTALLRDTVPTGHELWPGYGLGIEEMTTTCGVRLWGHTGSIPGYTTMSFATDDGARQVSVLFNQQDVSPDAALIAIGSVNIVNLEICGEPAVDLSESPTT